MYWSKHSKSFKFTPSLYCANHRLSSQTSSSSVESDLVPTKNGLYCSLGTIPKLFQSSTRLLFYCFLLSMLCQPIEIQNTWSDRIVKSTQSQEGCGKLNVFRSIIYSSLLEAHTVLLLLLWERLFLFSYANILWLPIDVARCTEDWSESLMIPHRLKHSYHIMLSQYLSRVHG